MNNIKNFDVIIIGGSYAGLAAALTLARAQRSVLIIDNGTPSNRNASHAHNFITHENESPALIREKAKKEVSAYPTVEFVHGEAKDVTRSTGGFYVTTIGGEKYFCLKLLFASGVNDIMPGIAGFSDCWGRSILHCPYCHGYEVKDQPIAVIADGEHAYHLCVLLSNLSKEISLFTNEKTLLSEEQQTFLTNNKVQIIESAIKAIEQKNGQLQKITLTNGSSYHFNVAFAKVAMRQQCEIPEQMGCKFNEHLIAVDDCMRTSIDGVYAAGDNCYLPRSIASVTAAGVRAAFQINWEITSTRFVSL